MSASNPTTLRKNGPRVMDLSRKMRMSIVFSRMMDILVASLPSPR